MFYNLPNLSMIPPDQLSKGVLTGLPKLDDRTFPSAEDRALAERGRYLYTVASCALCHRNDGSGGLKVSWRPMGSLWTKNLTPDVETGLGSWKDEEFARAIRSGISRDGHALHWQGMIWDHASNYDEEDIRALIVWLRAIPPVKNRVAAALPPTEADCATYTFFTSRDRKPASGCFTVE
jgi:mono/diheme cytochrome c family protein